MSTVTAHGRYTLTATRGDALLWHTWHDNFVTDAGLSYLAGVGLAGVVPFAAWYIGLKGGYQDALSSETLATKAWPEVNPGSGSRVAWTPTSLVPGALSNEATGAVITFGLDADVSGVFLASGPVIGNTTDLLFSVADWLTEQPLQSGDRLTISYVFSLVAADV